MDFEDLRLGVWLEHIKNKGLVQITSLDLSNVYFFSAENKENWGLPTALILEEWKLWRPHLDSPVRLVGTGKHSIVEDFSRIPCELAYGYKLKGMERLFTADQLTPYIDGETSGKSFTVKDNGHTDCDSPVNLDWICTEEDARRAANRFMDRKVATGICKADENGHIKIPDVGFQPDLIMFTPIHKPEPKCSCEGSGFLNAKQIPAEIFIEGTEAIVDWIDETNSPFEDSCCSCHINPPCSYCTDRTQVEVCSCNDFADDFKGQDPLEGKTYGDIIGEQTLIDAVDKLNDKKEKTIKTFRDMRFSERQKAAKENCMTASDQQGMLHEDSPDSHGKWMDDFQEKGRKHFDGAK